MPGWPVPEHLAEPTGPRGRLETVTLRSTATDSEREIQVYLPADYDGGSARYPLVLYHNGSSHQTFAQLDWSLDNLMGDEVAPAIVVLLPRVGQDFGGATTDAYVTMLVDELLPHLDRTYRTLTDPQTRTVMGAGSGGYVSAYAAFTRPGLFGKLATQSLYNNAVTVEALRAGVEGEKQDLDVYVEWSRHDYLYEDIGIDAARDSRELAELLEAKGYPVRRNVVTGAAGWGSWRAQLDDILGAFYPLAE
jgi:enterochelin esterase-like enzyme